MPPGIKLLLAQFISAALCISLIVPSLLEKNFVLDAGWQAWLMGALAAVLGRVIGMRAWWLPINLFFIPSLLAASQLELSPAWYLAAFLLLWLVYWSAARSQVPLYLSSRKAWQVVERRLPESASLADLGSGMGGMLVWMANNRKDGRFHGFENAPLPFVLSWIRARLAGSACQIRMQSFWAADLKSFDVVYAYLSPVPMPALWQKVRQEMRPGSLFISNSFAIPGVVPDEVLEVDDLHQSRLYLYRIQ
ncbi:MAG: class I SAM-dependent methyltransferase [Sulfuricellaceae bacterium]|nr:class I SAM-dependent methyltransferase [Sulfuricellaceae bacterium]